MIPFKVKKLSATASMPFRAEPGASGFDLMSDEDVHILPGEKKMISTGLAMEVPLNYEIQIRPRSGLAAKNGITVLNTPGTIDSSYRGEVKIVLFNTSPKLFEIKRGDRVAQAVVMALPVVELVETTELSMSVRSTGGFGSTGLV